MKSIIKLNKETLAVFQQGSIVETNGETYMYFPFWLKQTDEEDVFELLRLDELPDELVEYVKQCRDNPEGRGIFSQIESLRDEDYSILDKTLIPTANYER